MTGESTPRVNPAVCCIPKQILIPVRDHAGAFGVLAACL